MSTLVDARGVLCPVPIIRLARCAAGLAPGSEITLLTDDPAAEHDVPAWCRLRGHTLLESRVVEADAGSLPDAGPAPGSPAPGPGPIPTEPHAPNSQPGQVLRHLIRVEAPSAPGAPPATSR